MSATLALNALGSDVAFSVSFSIAVELRDAALDSGWRLEELILIVFATAVLLSVVPSVLTRVKELVEYNNCFKSNKDVGDEKADTDNDYTGKTILTFVSLIVEMAQRIAITLAIQLVAATAVSHEPLRAVRVLTLFSVAVFFLFLQNGSLNTVDMKT